MTTFTITEQTDAGEDFTAAFPLAAAAKGTIVVSTETATSFKVGNSVAGRDFIFRGHFTYNNGELSGGTLTEIDERVHGSTTPIAKFAGFSIPVLTFLSDAKGFADGTSQAAAAWAYHFTGGAGDDRFGTFGNSANDQLNGGSGDDSLFGNNGNDTLTGADGRDHLFGGGGNDHLIGGADNDLLVGGPGRDILDGGDGGLDIASYYSSTASGTIDGSDATGPVRADLADPTMNTGDAKGDTYIGIEGLEGTHLNDILIGDANGNFLIGGPGQDQLIGGGGFDFADYLTSTATHGLTADLADATKNTGDAKGDTYNGIEGLMGTSFADHLIGDGNDNFLNGSGGADTLDGGGGTDTAGYFTAAAGVHASLAAPGTNTGDAKGDKYISIENLQGSNFNDVLTGDGNGNVLTGRDGADRLIGGGGTDYAGYSHGGMTEGVHASLFRPATNTGEAAGDTYVGIEGLIGSAFNDVLVGNAQDNTLIGELGRDRLTGGGGSDAFVFKTLGGTTDIDTITDLVAGVDHISLDHSVFTNIGPLGVLSSNAFFVGTAAHDADDRIIYNSQNGALFYDPDGTGVAKQIEFAVLSNHAAIAASDIHIF